MNSYTIGQKIYKTETNVYMVAKWVSSPHPPSCPCFVLVLRQGLSFETSSQVAKAYLRLSLQLRMTLNLDLQSLQPPAGTAGMCSSARPAIVCVCD